MTTEETPAAEAPACNLPAEWDQDGDCQIDADAPVGDRGYDSSEELEEANRQGAQIAEECAAGTRSGPECPSW